MSRIRKRYAGLVIGCASALLLSTQSADASTSRLDAIGWQPVQTIFDQSPGDVVSVTTDNGLVVAAWTGPSFSNLWVSVRRPGADWTTPTKYPGSAAALTISKAGKGAWLMWQGFQSVSVMQVDPDGSLEQPQALGSSSDPFIAEPFVSVGGNGAVAAVWRTKDSLPASLAYRAAGSDDWTFEAVPVKGDIVGLDVGSAGTAQLVVSTGSNFRHQQLQYLRRTASGTWRAPVTVSTDATNATFAGNADGDIVVGWEIDNGNDTYGLAARYKASDDAGFDDTHHFADDAPYGSYVSLGIAASGALAAAYQTTDQGSSQLELTPADASGVWLTPQTLPLSGFEYDLAMNGAGSYVIVSEALSKGIQLVQCTAANVCGGAQTNTKTGYKFPSTSLGQTGGITLVWAKGCKGEACRPLEVVAQRGR